MSMLGVTPDMLHESLLDNTPPCSDSGWIGMPDEDCPNPATWQYRMTCGHAWLVCDRHHEEAVAEAAGIECSCGKRTETEHLIWRHI
jgi:hypothetical protein